MRVDEGRLLNWGGGPADSGFMRQIQVNVTNHFTFKKAKIAKQLHTKKMYIASLFLPVITSKVV